MRLLAVDTSTDACSVALMLDDNTIAELHEVCPRQHTERLLPMIDALLGDAGIQATDLDGFVLGAGPGSFTGVRLGTAAVQGLAWSLDREIVCISSLAVCAYGVCRAAYAQGRAVSWVAVAMDARMGEVYLGAYAPVSPDAGRAAEPACIPMHRPEPSVKASRSDPFVDAFSLRRLAKEQVCAPNALGSLSGIRTFTRSPFSSEAAISVDQPGAWIGAGSGWDIHQAALAEAFGAMPDWVATEALPRARDLVVLGQEAWLAGQACDVREARPAYLRNDVAIPRASS